MHLDHGSPPTHLFWDVDPSTIDLHAHKRWVIERVLEYGDDAAIRWLRQTYTTRDIADVVKASRALSRKTANFWRLVLGFPVEDVRALTGRDPLWPH